MKLEKRFNWTPEEKLGFLNKYQKKVISEVNFMPGAKDVLKMLKDDGHNLIVISARGSIIKEKTLEITEERLKQDNMYIFDKYYLAKANKEELRKDFKSLYFECTGAVFDKQNGRYCRLFYKQVYKMN